MASSVTLRLVDPEKPEEKLSSREIDLDEGNTNVLIDDNGVAHIENADGSITFDENPDRNTAEVDDSNFYRNLAGEIADTDLTQFASELLTGIDLDIQSRREWMQTRATGIRLLGLKIEEPSGDLGPSTAPLQGMTTIRHPLLLEATVRFQATARGELLPAQGPVKVRNDLPTPPDMPAPVPGAPPAPSLVPPDAPPQGQALDDLATALEKDMNHYLTVTAAEYVPDTDRMLFYIGFGGDGFKKVYNCPLRRRPVSESVDAEDIIISNAATDIRNCGRVTHRIKMRPSILKRMQILGEYRDVSLAPPSPVMELNEVEREKASIGGYKPQPQQPKDAEYEVYECYCELDIDAFAPKQFRNKALPLPYVVTIEKVSRQVLAIRRNWDEDDEQALAKQFFVQYPFIRGLGFYGLGLIHILGNVTMALTAIWRIMIDNGMFANFPGFLFPKQAGRQNTNQLRVPPGGGCPVDVPVGMRIQDAYMPLPYKETGAAFAQLASHIEEVGQRLGQTADLNIGEGRADVPVGTTMALIEQATKIMDSVHKRLHAAQSEEFGLLKERFREDPEAFWRHNKKGHQPARRWTEDQFRQALDQHELVPVADPNNPTSLHRIAKATIIDMLVTKYPQDMDHRGSLKRILRIADIDSDGLMNQGTTPPPPDPRMAAVQAKAQAENMKSQIDQAKLLLEKQKQEAQFADAATERQFKERMQQFEVYLEQLRVQAELVIHAHDLHRDNMESSNTMAIDRAKAAHGMLADHMSAQQDAQSKQAELARGGVAHGLDLQRQQQQHAHDMAAQRERHGMEMEQAHQKHAAALESAQQLAQSTIDNQRKIAEAKAQAVGPAEREKAEREGEKHDQQMQIAEDGNARAGEKHKVDLANSKALTTAKAAALRARPKSGDK